MNTHTSGLRHAIHAPSGHPRVPLPITCAQRPLGVDLVTAEAALDPALSLIDEYQQDLAPEITAIDTLLATVANVLETTSARDHQVRLAGLLEDFAGRIWRLKDPDGDMGAAAWIAERAASLIAYATGSDIHPSDPGEIDTVLALLDRSPRPLRARLVRAATRSLR